MQQQKFSPRPRNESARVLDHPVIAVRREQARAILDGLPADGGIYRHGLDCPCAGCIGSAVLRLVDPNAAWPLHE
jgi:hypothetical protein